jgi:hypothetical protein
MSVSMPPSDMDAIRSAATAKKPPDKEPLSFAKTGSGIGLGTADNLAELATSGTQWPT